MISHIFLSNIWTELQCGVRSRICCVMVYVVTILLCFLFKNPVFHNPRPKKCAEYCQGNRGNIMHDVNSSSHNLQKCLSGRHSLPALLNREVDNWVLPSISPEWIYVSIDHKYFEVGEHLPQWMGVTHATQLLQRVGKITSLTFVSQIYCLCRNRAEKLLEINF